MMEEELRHATFSVVTVSLAHNNSSVVFFSTSVEKIYNLKIDQEIKKVLWKAKFTFNAR